MKTKIHVNMHVIKANAKTGEQNPPLTVKDYKQNRKATRADIVVNGQVVASVVYMPDDPLSCGAKCWVETENEVIVS